MTGSVGTNGFCSLLLAKRRLWIRIPPSPPAIYFLLLLSAVFLGAFVASCSAFLLCTMFRNYFYLSSMVTLVQVEVRPDQRVMSGALLLLVMNFIGLGLGPTHVGTAGDFFQATHPGQSLQMALHTLAPLYVVAISLFLVLSRVFFNERPTAGVRSQ